MKTVYVHKTIWTENDKLHRIDGPAIIYGEGYEEYYVHGYRHRLDGPAIIYPDGTKYYFINGKLLTKKAFDMYHFVSTL